jgi:hypothetical protein
MTPQVALDIVSVTLVAARIGQRPVDVLDTQRAFL